MKNAKFTPGPWSAYRDRINLRENQVFITAETTGWGNDIIAEVETGGAPEREANVNLILAAPELYDLLSRALSDVCEHRNYLPDQGDTNPPPFILEIENALKKARGDK